MEHYERLMGDVHVAVVARAVWERLPKAERPGGYADAQFAVADIDTLCGYFAETFVDEAERARAAEFIKSAPALTEQVVTLLRTEDSKWPHISGNAGLGALQLRFCWAWHNVMTTQDLPTSTYTITCRHFTTMARV
eukprot:COSAG06_NODE_24923_length_648_cov_0.903636_1_plen_135_part_10